MTNVRLQLVGQRKSNSEIYRRQVQALNPKVMVAEARLQNMTITISCKQMKRSKLTKYSQRFNG